MSEQKAMQVRDRSKVSVTQITNVEDLDGYARRFAQSGMFKDASDVAKAAVKIQAGAELGFPPFQSMNGVHIIQGRAVLSASLMAAAIKRSGRYHYSVKRHTDQECVLVFREKLGNEWVDIGESGFSWQEAQNAKLTGKDNWRNYPKNMLFARALSNGARWHCPDVFGGAVYSVEELDETGGGQGGRRPSSEEASQAEQELEVIDVDDRPDPTEAAEKQIRPEPQPEQPAPETAPAESEDAEDFLSSFDSDGLTGGER